jgi:hypothetical protein
MTTPDDQRGIWLTADYRFVAVFSYRMPMSSITAARVLPTPGPATVRLALVRTGFELFGEEMTRQVLFPTIRAMAVRIQPPEQVAFSWQTIRGYKATSKRDAVILNEAPTEREMAHTADVLRIAINVPPHQEELFRAALAEIGFWGQASGLAWCTQVVQEVPEPARCIVPLRLVQRTRQIGTLFTGLATEFRDDTVRWEEVMPELIEKQSQAIKPEVYVWPLRVIEQRSTGMILGYCSRQGKGIRKGNSGGRE